MRGQPIRSSVRLAVVLGAALAFALTHGGAAFAGQCGSPPCWTTFTINGGAAPAGVTLETTSVGGNITVQLKDSNNADQNELSPDVATTAVVHMVLNIGTYDPVVFGTTGLIQSYSTTTGASNTVTLDVKPRSSSWAFAGCTITDCGGTTKTADVDYTSMVLGFITDLSGIPTAIKDAARGMYFGTNAQAFSFPTFDSSTGAVNFTVAAPHFKSNGSTVNTGFFQFFAPQALELLMGIDPAKLTTGSVQVTSSSGSAVTVSVTQNPSPAGLLIEAGTNPPTLPTFNYSSPTFTVVKAPAPPAPDTTPPTFSSVPASQTLEATGPGGAVATYTPPTAVDAVDGPVAVICDPPSGSTFPVRPTVVTCSAHDSAANTGRARFTITVVDTTPPVLSGVPSPLTVEATGAAGATVQFAIPTATDLVAGPLYVGCSLAPGIFPLGTTTVTCFAKDPSGNTGSASITITVRDTTPPALSGVPSTQTVEATGPSGAAVQFALPTAVDLVSGAAAVTCDHTAGSIFTLGSTAVTCRATDSTGNAASATFTVIVRDTTPPELQLPEDLVVDALRPSGAPARFKASASDLVAGAVHVTCRPASGSIFPVGKTRVKCTAGDGAGNTATDTFTVRVLGAGEQLAAIRLTAPAKAKLLAQARKALAAGKNTDACRILATLVQQLPAGRLRSQVQRAAAAAGC